MSEYDSPRGYNPQDHDRYGRTGGSPYDRRNPSRNNQPRPNSNQYGRRSDDPRDAQPFANQPSNGQSDGYPPRSEQQRPGSGQYRARLYEANQPHPGSPGYGRPRNAGMPQPSTGRPGERRNGTIVPPYSHSTDNLHLAGSGRYDHDPNRGAGNGSDSGRRNMNRQMVGTPLRQSTRDRYERQRPRTYDSYHEERLHPGERSYEDEAPASGGRIRYDASELRRSGRGGYEVDYAYDPAISQRRRESRGTARRGGASGGRMGGAAAGAGEFFAGLGGRLADGASGLFGRLCDLPRPVLIGAIAVLAVLIVLLFTLNRQPAELPDQDTSQVAAETSESESSSSSSTEVVTLSASDVTKSLTKAGVDADLAKEAGTLSESDNRIAQIAANASAYNVDGSTVQQKLLELAIKEPEAIDFVLNWPDKYPTKKGESYEDEVTQGTFPRLYQWDQRWGYTEYSGTTFALTGCCPTALSMVYMGLTGNNDKTPYDLAKLAKKDGYMTDLNGTVATFLTEDAQKLGLKCEQLDLTKSALKKALENGAGVICNVGAGDFTDNGHYFVITGIDEDGKLTINDPYSAARSEKHWSISKVLGQTVALYSFTAE